MMVLDQTLEHRTNMEDVLLQGAGENKDVDQVHKHIAIYRISEDVIGECLDSCCIFEVEQHYRVLIVAVWGAEGHPLALL